MIAGELFVTPHAVRQFQSRIAPWMSYEQALGAVIRELRGAKEFHPTMNGKAIMFGPAAHGGPGGDPGRRDPARGHHYPARR